MTEDINELRQKLRETEEVLQAIQNLEVDAVVAHTPQGDQVFTLMGAERPYRTLVETMSEGAGILDEDGVLLFANDSIARMLRTPLETVIGSSIRKFVLPERLKDFDALFEKGMKSASKAELQLVAFGGVTVPVYLSINKVKVDGRYGACLVAFDLSEQKWLERNRDIAEDELRKFLGQMERRVEERTAELASVNIELRASENQFRTMAETIPQLAWMADPDGGIFWYNQRWFDYTGSNLEGMRGWQIETVLDPKVVDQIVRRYREAIQSGNPWEDTLQLRSKSGEWRWFLARAVPIRNSEGKVIRWFGTHTDITEQKGVLDTQRFLSRVSAVLTTSLAFEQTLHSLIELANAHISDGCCVSLTQEGSAPQLVSFGYPSGWRRESIEDLQRNLSTNVILTGKAELYSQNSDKFLSFPRELSIGSAMVVPLLARGKVLGAMSFYSTASSRIYGITDLLVAEEIGRRAGIAVDNIFLYRQAQDAIRTREDVISIVSHDLKNPITGILLASTALERIRPNQDPTQLYQRQVQSITLAAKRMQSMIETILNVGKLETGKLFVEPRAETTEALIAEAVEMLQPIAAEKSIRLTWELGENCRPVWCDRLRTGQILSNLLGNAIKFTPIGGTVLIRAERNDNEVIFSVQDSGPGIPQNQQDFVFQRYWQAPGTMSQGSGLGLFIAKQIVEAHGGHIWLKSEPGQGSTFYFTLPVNEVRKAA